MKTHRLAILASHPIQYQGPWFHLLAQHPRVDLEVLFCSAHGQTASYDALFDREFKWDRPLTDGYAHRYVKNVHPTAGPFGFWNNFNPDLWSLLRRDRFDSLMLLGWGHASAWLAAAAAKAHGLSLVIRGESHLGPASRPPWKTMLREGVLRSFFRTGDAFLAIGARNAQLYRAYGVPEEKIRIAPYAVDNDFFASEHDRLVDARPAMRAALGVEDDRPIIVVSGKIYDHKRPLDVLNAFARARREDVQAKLVFIGDGPQRGALEAEVARRGLRDDVTITGFVNQSMIPRHYTAADILVLASQGETWGLVVNEAMLFELPVLCTTEVPAGDELVVPGVTGDVFPSGDVDRLAWLLARYLRDPGELREMGLRARLRVEGYNFHRCVEVTVEALDSLATHTSRHEPSRMG